MTPLQTLLYPAVVSLAVWLIAARPMAVEWRSVEEPDDPRVLPYNLVEVKFEHTEIASWSRVDLIDVDGDGLVNYTYHYSVPMEEGHHKSAVVAASDWRGSHYPVQYNGPYMSALIWESRALDVWGGPGREIILTKVHKDTVLLEVIAFGRDADGITIDTGIVVQAAIGRGLTDAQWWHSLHVYPLGAVDLNGDGTREMLFSRIAKPDSSIQRGLVAWDFAASRPLWFFPTADAISPSIMVASGRTDRPPVLLVSQGSNSNRYSANGMDSQHSYLLALDFHGRELWRTTLGGAGWHTDVVGVDVDGDGVREVCVSGQPGYPDSTSDTLLRVYDPWTGQTVRSLEALENIRAGSLLAVLESDREPPVLFFSTVAEAGAMVIFRLDQNLAVSDAVDGLLLSQPVFFDLDSDGESELLCVSKSGRMAIVNDRLELLAEFRSSAGEMSAGMTPDGTRLMLSSDMHNLSILSYSRQSLLVRAWAGFRPYLEFLLAALAIFLLIRGVAVVRRWRLAALGVPTLNRIDAMVLLLDTKGKILFANRHELTREVLGNPNGRRVHYHQTALAGHSELKEALDQSFLEPMGVQQHLLDLSDGSGLRRLQVTIYPHVDANNCFLGKIAVCEELTGRRARQWKLIMGEAAQRWVHRLKHNIGTARMVLGNIADDPVVAERLTNSHAVRGQWEAADLQILEGSRTATRILRFLANPLPNRTECDINNLVEMAVEARRAGWPESVSVSLLRQEELPRVRVDRDQILEVVDNLLSNAEKAISGAGTITVHTRLAEGLRDDKCTSTIELCVEDTGCGIAEDDLPRLFEPGFSRTPGGSGIGLPLVREIVENHGGSVVAERRADQGSRFTITLPL